MSETLKKCPCCGNEPEIVLEDDAHFGTDRWYRCSNIDCTYHYINLVPADWQSRYIEDSLLRQLNHQYQLRDDILDERDILKKKLDLATRFLTFQLVHEYDIDEYYMFHKSTCRKCAADKVLEEIKETR